MCGGSLEVTAGETIIECEYCGTQQTLPKTTDENIQALFNRANLLRQKNEFDKAEAVYEKILEADDTEAEAYWGVILCKFGIEYVEDPKTYKRIPTCHRTSYDSIVADEYYKKAIENADITQRTIYEAEAKKIDEIQKGILAISAQEEPYDVFICYKETDESGKTPVITLETPPRSASLSPGGITPYSLYDVEVSHRDYYTVVTRDVQVYPDTTSILPVNMLPLPDTAGSEKYPSANIIINAGADAPKP
jgi:tetratricopeptide (TPR) repeat protein